MLYIFLRVAHLQVSELIPTQLHPHQLKNLILLLFLKCTEDLGEKNHEQKSFGKPNAHCLSPRRPMLDSTAQCVHFQKLSEKGSLGLVVKNSGSVRWSWGHSSWDYSKGWKNKRSNAQTMELEKQKMMALYLNNQFISHQHSFLRL